MSTTSASSALPAGHKEKDLDSTQHIDKSSTSQGSVDLEEEAPELHFKTYIVVIAGSLAFLTYVWALVAFGLNQRTIAAAVGSSQDYVWIQNAAQLVSLVVAPPMGKMSDAVGRKWLVIFGLLVGTVGLCLTGGATTIAWQLLGSAIFGFASGSVYILSALVSEILPRRLRGVVQGFFNINASAGGLIGAIGGQALSATKSIGGRPGYQFALYVPAVTMFVSSILIALCYNPPPTPNPENRSLATRYMDFDKVGTLLLIAGITPLTIGLTWGGSIYPWNSARTYAPLTVGCLFLVLLAAHQVFYKKNGLFNHEMFQGRNTALACGIVFVQGLFYFTYNGYFGEELNILFESRPVVFGFRFGIFFLGNFVGYTFVGWYTRRFKAVKAPLVVSFLVFAIVMIVQSQAKATSSWNKAFIVTPVLGGLVYPAPEVLLFVIGQLDVPPQHVGTVSTLLGSIRALGGVIGVSVGNTIFTSKIAHAFSTQVPAALVEAGVPVSSIPDFIGALTTGNTAALSKIPGATPQAIAAGGLAVQQSYIYAFPFLWYFVLPFTVVAFFMACGLADVTHQMTWIVNRPVEEIHYKRNPAKHHVEEQI